MSTYPRIEVFFDKFIASLDCQQLSSTERKLINLVRNNFDDIASSGTSQGKRGKTINTLVVNQGSSVSDVLPQLTVATAEGAFPVLAITDLAIEDFRGFSLREDFAFPKRITLIYGPNGTGKSSFCEALEYSMLGYVVEANTKRIEIDKYIKNSSTGRSAKPILKGKGLDGVELLITPAPFAYYFCFVEKNRIEDFARLSSYTPAEQQNLLSRLFGLEEFNKFVDEFTDNISNYIDIKGKQTEELRTKLLAIERDKSLVAGHKDNLLLLDKDGEKICADAGLNKSIDELEKYLDGAEGQNGRLSDLDTEIQRPLSKAHSHVSTDSLLLQARQLKALTGEYSRSHQEYVTMKDKLIFRQLFEAVNKLKDVVPDKCPVCETPIKGGIFGYKSVNKDPYLNARRKLEELNQIAAVEDKRDSQWREVRESLNALRTLVATREGIVNEIGFSKPSSISFPTFEPTEHDQSFIGAINKALDNVESSSVVLKSFDLEVDRLNSIAANEEQYRSQIKQEKARLLGISQLLKNLRTKRSIYVEEMEKSEAAIKSFNLNNAVLVQNAGDERKQLETNKEFVLAYADFKAQLVQFKTSLPVGMVAGLNELTKSLYNKINFHDATSELIEKIELPLSSEKPIRIWFQDDPSREFNALQILSEGHIRCLGLSILLAKVIQLDCKVVVFDDIVNAIDDDHRAGVRELIFTDPQFAQRQIILTTHAEQFIKDLDNEFPMAKYNETIERYTFLYPENRAVRYQKTTSNYLKKAKEDLDHLEKSDALTNCRKALENISSMLWTKLSRRYQVQLSVAMRSPKSSPDLMSIVTGLIAFLKKNDPANHTEVITLFEWISGTETANHNVWSYLNKGTHEEVDRQELDQTIVEKLFEKLVELDAKTK